MSVEKVLDLAGAYNSRFAQRLAEASKGQPTPNPEPMDSITPELGQSLLARTTEIMNSSGLSGLQKAIDMMPALTAEPPRPINFSGLKAGVFSFSLESALTLGLKARVLLLIIDELTGKGPIAIVGVDETGKHQSVVERVWYSLNSEGRAVNRFGEAKLVVTQDMVTLQVRVGEQSYDDKSFRDLMENPDEAIGKIIDAYYLSLNGHKPAPLGTKAFNAQEQDPNVSQKGKVTPIYASLEKWPDREQFVKDCESFLGEVWNKGEMDASVVSDGAVRHETSNQNPNQPY